MLFWVLTYLASKIEGTGAPPREPWGCRLHRGHATPGTGPTRSCGMVNLAATRWPWLLRERWVLVLILARLLLLYFLTSTFKQEKRAVRGRNLLQGQDHDQPFRGKYSLTGAMSISPAASAELQSKEVPHHGRTWLHLQERKRFAGGCAMTALSDTKQDCRGYACPAAGEPTSSFSWALPQQQHFRAPHGS